MTTTRGLVFCKFTDLVDIFGFCLTLTLNCCCIPAFWSDWVCSCVNDPLCIQGRAQVMPTHSRGTASALAQPGRHTNTYARTQTSPSSLKRGGRMMYVPSLTLRGCFHIHCWKCVFSALIKNLEAGPGPIFGVHKCDVETSGLQCTNTGNEHRVEIK